MNIAILKLKTTALFPIKVISIKEYSNDNLYRCTDTACRSMNITRVQASGSLDQTSVKFWGAWPAGVYIWEQSTNQWAKMPDTEGVLEIAAGNIAGGTADDLVGCMVIRIVGVVFGHRILAQTEFGPAELDCGRRHGQRRPSRYRHSG